MAKRSTWRRTGPSAVAQHRLAEAIRRNRAELENEVTEGLLRSELYLETGRPDVAAEVIEEQRSKIVAFEGRVREAIAAAAVEAEAEAVLARAEAVLARAEAATDLQERPEPTRVPQLVAAVIAAVASMAVFTSVDGARDADGLRAAVRIDSTDQLASPSDTPSRFGPIAGSHDVGYVPFDYVQALHRPTPHDPATVDDPETRRWLLEQEALLEALGMNVHVRGEVMRELEGLMSTLAPGTPLPDEVWLEVLSVAAARAQAQAQAQADDDAQAEDGSMHAESEAGSDPDPDAGSDSGSGDGSWFPADGEATGEQDDASGATGGHDGEPGTTDDATSAEGDDGEPASDDSPDDGSDAGTGGLLAGVAQDDEG